MAKTANYTSEMVELMTGMYLGVRDKSEAERDAVVAELGSVLGKGERSVRAKLARLFVPGTQEQLYIAKKTVSKVTGEDPAKKVELATRLVAIAGEHAAKVDPERVAKMNKTDITAFIKAFEARDEVAADADAESAESEDYSESSED